MPHSQTLKERATQLLRRKSGALVTQCPKAVFDFLFLRATLEMFDTIDDYISSKNLPSTYPS